MTSLPANQLRAAVFKSVKYVTEISTGEILRLEHHLNFKMADLSAVYEGVVTRCLLISVFCEEICYL